MDQMPPPPPPPLSDQEQEALRAAKVMAAIDQQILSSGLNHREIKFAMKFVETRDPVRSAEYAGYSPSLAAKYPARWLDETSPDYKPKLAAMIRLKTEAVSEAEALTVHDLIAQLKATVFTDPLDFFDTSGGDVFEDDEGEMQVRAASRLRDISEIPLHARMSIQEIEQTALAGGKVLKTKFKIRDKEASIDKLMRWLGGYERDNLQRAESYVVLAAPIPASAAKVVNVEHVPSQPQDMLSLSRSRNQADMIRSNEWVAENELDDPIIINKP